MKTPDGAVAWFCTERATGKLSERKLIEPCVATNHAYVLAHRGYNWQALIPAASLDAMRAERDRLLVELRDAEVNFRAAVIDRDKAVNQIGTTQWLLDESLKTIKLNDSFLAALSNDMKAAGISFTDENTLTIINDRALKAESKLAAVGAERDVLRAFANDVMEEWWEGDLDGGSRQDIAERHGLIAPQEVTEPCSDTCVCAEVDAFPLMCFRRTELLTGTLIAEAGTGEGV